MHYNLCVSYEDHIKSLLSPAERMVFSKLRSPHTIQSYLDSLPINFETSGETYMSPRRVLQTGRAHCFEGALLAAAALAYHGQRPLILDLKTSPNDEDHVVALFKQNGCFGALSKTNHATLRYRDPIYKTVRELALSYFHEYFLPSGAKTLRSYSKPFDLSKYAAERWLTAEEDLFWLVEELDNAPHVALISRAQVPLLRKAAKFEVETTAATEWQPPKS